MGVFGAGNAGSAVTKFLAPALIAAGSWQLVPKVFSAILFITALLFWFLSADNKAHRSASGASLREQLASLKDPAVWRYCQYYSIVFGGYVALALWMTKYYVQEYGFSLQSAALLAACFSLPGGVLRAVGGWMSDRWGAQSVTWWVLWVSWICLFLLSYPQTQLQVQTINGPVDFHIGLNPALFTVLLFVMGIAFAFGKASVFKYIANDYPKNMGAVSGIVGLAGGLGGFVLPIMFGALVDLTGVRSSCFMLLYGVVWVSLTWMYISEVRKSQVLGKEPTLPRS
ncbi:putative nitrate transporter NarT [compost metagenome]